MLYSEGAGKHYHYTSLVCALLIGFVVALFNVGAINTGITLQYPVVSSLKNDAAAPTGTRSTTILAPPPQPLQKNSSVPPTPTMTPVESLYNFVSTAPSIGVGTGSKDIYVLFDPSCKHCHDFYKEIVGGLDAQQNIRSHWIPSLLFTNQKESLVYGVLLTELASQDKATAESTLASLMDKTPVPVPDDWKPSQKAVESFTEATRKMMETLKWGGGTPVVIWKKPSGEIEVFAGIPTGEDWKTINT